MTDLILATFITSLLCNGLNIATGEDMLLEPVKNWLDSVFIKTLHTRSEPIVLYPYYPILYCIKCMPSFYGTIVCLVYLPFTLSLLWQIPVVILMSVCLTTILFHWYE